MKKSLALALTVFIALTGCGKSLQKDVVGKWSYEVSFPMEDQDATGQINAKCKSEFFANKSITHDCDLKVTMEIKTDKTKVDISGKLRATGEWSVNDKTLLDKMTDGKVELSEVKVNGDLVADKAVIDEMSQEIKGAFLKGETTAYVTRSFDGKTWVFDQEIDNKKVTITATRN